MSQQTRGMWLGLLGVAIFAVTLPMTRLATGTAEDPQLSAWFITFGRAALAGALSIAFLLITRSPWPTQAQCKPLLFALLGNVIGFPLLLGFALVLSLVLGVGVAWMRGAQLVQLPSWWPEGAPTNVTGLVS